MATKWAHYVITAVHFNSAGTHIEEVKTREHTDDGLSGTTTRTRARVVSLLESGSTFCTATKGSDDLWHKGAAVKIYEYDREKFIKTKADGIKKDNLDNLPTF
jgi:hypothetical protein